MSHELIAKELAGAKERIALIYAFNATGKTRLSVAYKNETKDDNGSHAGVYYNAYSEDLFVWDNDSENGEVNVQLDIRKSSLNRFHSSLSEDNIRNKLNRFGPDYRFDFIPYDNPEDGIKSVLFFDEVADPEDPNNISKFPQDFAWRRKDFCLVLFWHFSRLRDGQTSNLHTFLLMIQFQVWMTTIFSSLLQPSLT